MKSSNSSAAKRAIWRNKRVWAAILIFIVASSSAIWYFLVRPNTVLAQSSQTTAQVLTTSVKRGDIQLAASGSATLVASKSVDLSFSSGGRVTELNVKNGDRVTAGQVLASVGSSAALQANAAALEYQLLEAQNNLTDLQQNGDVALAQAYQDWVTAQQTYATALTASQRTAYARCSQEVNTKYKAALDLANANLEKAAKLYDGSDAWINARNNYDTALANYTYCAAYTADEKTNAQAALDVAKTTLQQTETSYKTLQTASGIDPTILALYQAKVTSLQTQLADAQEKLAGITLTAPITGKVVYLAAEQGIIVGTTKFITIADVSQPMVQVSVDETDMDKLKLDSAATIVFDALPDLTFSGKVVQVDPELVTSGQYKVSTGLIELNADAAKTIQNLPLGLNATVTLVNQEVKGALLVPVTALKKNQNNETTVTLVDASGKTTQQTVTVGIQDGTNAEIKSGLKEGDLVSLGSTKTNSSSSSNNSGSMPGGPDGGMPPSMN
jgi:HlyD family secretion protein